MLLNKATQAVSYIFQTIINPLYPQVLHPWIQLVESPEAEPMDMEGRLYSCCMCDQSWPALCNPMDYSPSGSSVHGTSQARILEWVVIPFSRGSSQPRDRTLLHISCIGRQILCGWATWEIFMVLHHFVQGTWIPMDFGIFRGLWNQSPMDT